MRILVVTAVRQESEAVVRGLAQLRTATAVSVNVLVGGVGPVAAAVATADALATDAGYDCVISGGIAGGFAGRTDIGDIVVATASVAADLGCRTEDGFLTLSDLGLEQESTLSFPHAPAWASRIGDHEGAAVTGDVLTLSCMTGTDSEATSLASRHPQAVAEAMEGYGVAWAAQRRGVARVGEIRSISNVIGKRDVPTWNFDAAFDALSRAFAALFTEPLP